MRNLIKLKGTAKLTAQGEWVSLKDSKYILFEILANTLACKKTGDLVNLPYKPGISN